MATIECPRCETTFETKATTATRCRSCRSVVHVGGGPGRRSSAADRATTAWGMESAGDDEDGGIGLVLVLVAVGVGIGVYLYFRARRRRKGGEENEA
ncbi:MAG: hypothetical protein M0Z46_09175 [Actinomycetota bacterium]|jgi:hypothetical protein|nr:hypothetical protein [Actinomycetota bacterium]